AANSLVTPHVSTRSASKTMATGQLTLICHSPSERTLRISSKYAVRRESIAEFTFRKKATAQPSYWVMKVWTTYYGAHESSARHHLASSVLRRSRFPSIWNRNRKQSFRSTLLAKVTEQRRNLRTTRRRWFESTANATHRLLLMWMSTRPTSNSTIG